VLKVVKADLASKLNSFYILYYGILLVVSAGTALSIATGLVGVGWGYLAFFFIANAIYFTFLMLLSLSYELYQKVGWHTALAILALVLLWPWVQPFLTMWRPLIPVAVMAGAMLLLFAIGFYKRARAAKRMMAALAKVRSNNLQENKNRKEFVREAVEFLSQNEPQVWFRPKFLRRLARESAAGVAYMIKEDDECYNKVEALQEFVKLHRLRDAIGRLAVALSVAGALAYAMIPLSDVADAVALVALKVLPVYGAALFIMDQFDLAKEDAFGELQRVIISNPGKGAGTNGEGMAGR
jgi:ABC-type multidrug transport system fused ATPase/permease subunit